MTALKHCWLKGPEIVKKLEYKEEISISELAIEFRYYNSGSFSCLHLREYFASEEL